MLVVPSENQLHFWALDEHGRASLGTPADIERHLTILENTSASRVGLQLYLVIAELDCDDPFLNEITNQQGLESVMEATTVNENFNGNSCATDTNYDYECPTGPDMVADCNSCDPPEGCTDELACNYDYLAVVSIIDACFYVPDYCPDLDSPEYYDCDCKCLNDADLDEVCDELEVEGCPDPTACNYNPDGTGLCIFPVDLYGVNNVDCNGNSLND